MSTTVNYNERSWAIDLIGHIKAIATSQNHTIKNAGGEQTVRIDGGNMFPDILLFGDQTLALILQGWELKMPDTDINDFDFKQNAEYKANALGLDSFVLWNVSYARLYIKEEGRFVIENEWDDLSYIIDRSNVTEHQDAWKKLATTIISYINDLFDRGSLEGRPFVEAYRSGGVTSLIMENTEEVAEALETAVNQNAKLRAEITLWWERHKTEYGGQNYPYRKLAQANISNWIGKFLFAHILQGRDQRAQIITDVNEDTSTEEALAIFDRISQECNFWTIFSKVMGLEIMPKRAWLQMLQFNRLLTDLRVGSIGQSQLSRILEATVEVSVRKLRGQYPTPFTLARLLVHLCTNNLEEDRILDPCCGSGTIVRAALEQKLAAGINPEMATNLVFAGDQDPQAVQITTFAIAKPSLMNTTLRIFRQDAFHLNPDTELQFRDPMTGEKFTEQAGYFHTIVSNLPFVGQKGRKQYEKSIAKVTGGFDSNSILPGNSDIAAYLPFALHPLLTNNGKLGIIITNAWLGTAWGNAFFDLVTQYYHLRSVVTSGAGRWFQNSKVVTNILVLQKKDDSELTDDSINFVVLSRPLAEIQDLETINLTASQILIGSSFDDTMRIRSVTYDNIRRFRVFGLDGNAQFVDCDWVLTLPLKPLSNYTHLYRGKRRGCNKMFYPQGNHKIEDIYLTSVAKSSREVLGYVTKPSRQAFICNLSEQQLREKKHFGALQWIDRFRNSTRTRKGKTLPLPDALQKDAKKGSYWYEMKADKFADLILPLNPGGRIFFSKLEPSSLADQRLTCLSVNDNVDKDLVHALLNTAIAMFMIEGMGFGRGEGVLDLSSTRINRYMHILDPDKLTTEDIAKIKTAFNPLKKRKILDVADELEEKDRQHFDEVILNAFNLSIERPQIYKSLLQLVEIRKTATENFTRLEE